ncbi:MAG: molybdopterin-guanine dinucleotide biosynthesis protein B [Hyphomicrobiaceae bacterium]|nr:molybdopterin-guanine dinucleotide biosynthesis protein B [Hyphomicrobiaceae bacterium]
MSDGTPIIGIVGWKNSGKTTLTVALIGELVRRGYRVASIKHAHHNLRIDDKDTDSARHRQAGAAQVAVVSEKRWAIVTELNGTPEPDFQDMLSKFEPCDIIVVEGYKSQPIPKIEARRSESANTQPLATTDPNVIAIATDHAIEDAGSARIFSIDAITSITDFIITSLAVSKRKLGA